jgi:FAD/FMN-containing dehydrogenase
LDPSIALNRIAEIVGDRGVVETSDAAAYLVDHRGLYAGAAAAIVAPASTDEVAAVLRVCNEAHIGVVPQAGNTGYCGGATPFDAERQIVLSLARMRQIRRVDPVGFTLTADAGVILADAQAAAEREGLFLPLSLGSEGSCRIGGNLSTNAGGLNVVRYGMARDLVLGLEVVLPSGDVLNDLKGLRKDNTGYDLKQLFIGAEGTLGVITAAVLKLFAQPLSVQTAWLAVTDVDAANAVVGLARRSTGDMLVSAEYLSRTSLALVLEHLDGTRDPLAGTHDHYLLIELAGPLDEAQSRALLEQLLERELAAGRVVDGAIAESNAQRDALWALRESIPEGERHAGQCVKHDISIPIAEIPVFLDEARLRLAQIAAHRLSVFGHLGDGNLHYNLVPPVGEEFAPGIAVALTETLYDYVDEIGGSFSAEHGIGLLRRDQLAHYKPPLALELMRQLKRAIDPNGIMNPGKLFDDTAA